MDQIIYEIDQTAFGDKVFSYTPINKTVLEMRTPISVSQLDPNKCWSIKNPINLETSEFGELRTIGTDTYYLSKQAAHDIPYYETPQSSFAIVRFKKEGSQYIIVCGLNNNWFMHCGTLAKKYETPTQCCVRALKEELALDVRENALIPYAEYQYKFHSKLVGNETILMTQTVYLLDVNYSSIEHLVQRNTLHLVHNNLQDINVYKVIDYPFILRSSNNTMYIAIIKSTAIELFRWTATNRANSQHKKMALDLFNIKNDTLLNHLYSFRYL